MHVIVKFIAEYFILIPIFLTALEIYRLRRRTPYLVNFTLLLLLGGIGSLLLAKLGSYLINDPRPFVVGHFMPYIAHAADNGFPSDHTLLAAFLGWSLWCYSRKLGLISLLLAILIGVSRMVAGLHHFEDVIGSFVIAGIGCNVVQWGVARYRPVTRA